MENWKPFLKMTYKEVKDNKFIRNWWISDHGRIKWTYDHNDRQRFVTPTPTGGHTLTGRYLALSINNAPEKYIHRLVALYFVPNPTKEVTVNHIDGNKQNNHYSNLEWVSYKDNTVHGMKLRGKFDQERYDKNQKRRETETINRNQRRQRIDKHLTLHIMGVECKHISTISGYPLYLVKKDIKKYA